MGFQVINGQVLLNKIKASVNNKCYFLPDCLFFLVDAVVDVTKCEVLVVVVELEAGGLLI